MPNDVEDTSIMTEDERKNANKTTVDKLLKLQGDIEDRTEQQTKKVQDKAQETYRSLTIMIWLTFLFGVGLIFVSLWLFVFEERTLQVLGIGTLGAADLLALFLYKPMDRLQKANADFAQQFTLLKSWATTVNLELLAMNVTKPETVTAAAKNIHNTSVEIAKVMQEFIE